MSIHRHWILLIPLMLAGCSQGATTISSSVPTSAPPTLAASAPASATSVPTVASAQPAPTQASSSINCTGPAALTPAMTEGPYFKAGSPERASLYVQGMAGTKLAVTGYVLTADCKPIGHALLEFWQADAKGNYDNSGYTLRGHQFTDNTGRYQLTTVVPGLYPGRTEHIHVKVQAPNGPIVTTQLFFPGVAQNQSDSIFNQKLLLAMQNTNDGIAATYNFVITTK